MKLIELEQYYRFDEIFDSGIIAGFSAPRVAGIMPRDFYAILDLAAPKNAAYMKQIHTDIVRVIDAAGVYEGDALFSDKADLGLVVRTADCLPIVLSNQKQGIIGVVHLGWKSAQAGIIENISYDLTDFTALAGIGMRQCCYQVGEDFLEYNRLSGYVQKNTKELYFDPIAFAKTQLIKKGLASKNFFDIGMCSMCDNFRFPSCRRDKTDDRTLTFIFRKH